MPISSAGKRERCVYKGIITSKHVHKYMNIIILVHTKELLISCRPEREKSVCNKRMIIGKYIHEYMDSIILWVQERF